MSSELLTPSDCALVVEAMQSANEWDRAQLPEPFPPDAFARIHQRENIIAKLQLKARAADAQERR